MKMTKKLDFSISREDCYIETVKLGGYAGGITSAAMDGVLVAECIAKKYKN